ncbi:MAG: hypothetical protein AAF629_28245 [Chloroflexota bacterium]
MTNNNAPPKRITIPFLIDLVIVSTEEHIRKVEQSEATDRLHVFETSALPWWVKFYFKATKFHDVERDLWFCPFEPTSNPDYVRRRMYLQEQVDHGYSSEDVQHIAGLLRSDVPDEVLAHAMVQVVNKRFFGEEIPQSMSQIAGDTLTDVEQAILPWKYSRGRVAQKSVMDYCEKHLADNVHILDIGHNIGEVVQTTAGALRILKENLNQQVETIFTNHPLTPEVPRIAVKASTIDGLLRQPTTPGKTIFICKIGKAAAETGNLDFTFGTGEAERACVFKDFFVAFMTDVQCELKGVPNN